MKRAKKRGTVVLARLIASTRRADKAITSALNYVMASNRRLAAKHKLSNKALKALINEGRD